MRHLLRHSSGLVSQLLGCYHHHSGASDHTQWLPSPPGHPLGPLDLQLDVACLFRWHTHSCCSWGVAHHNWCLQQPFGNPNHTWCLLQLHLATWPSILTWCVCCVVMLLPIILKASLVVLGLAWYSCFAAWLTWSSLRWVLLLPLCYASQQTNIEVKILILREVLTKRHCILKARQWFGTSNEGLSHNLDKLWIR